MAVYDGIADWFDRTRTRELIEKPYLDLLVQMLKRGASVLDVGCGTGEPILRFLVERQFRVTGVDASAAMISIAAGRFPEARLMVGDMRELALDETYDAAILWHSLFHLQHEDQRAMFAALARLLNPGGVLMFTSGSEYGETWSDNGGAMLYHAALDLREYRSLLEANRFEVVKLAVDDAACGGATVWIARRQ
ncbi:class I SAM-dependent DNA methyltransferase [Massilia sp. SM-13]|uniref:class I SAM-dependent DNA methyltransferase n=1 Tax=Pseudoduganella rhizocola TaxID=3382643 RepID=UPI0038B602A4